MIRVEMELSTTGEAPNDVMAVAAYLSRQMVDLTSRGTVVHRFTVEEADA